MAAKSAMRPTPRHSLRCRSAGAFAWDAFGIGLFHSCAIRDLGRTFCWGQNLQGALGDATTAPRNTPVPVRP
jgi:alpha-tubulin suppressor-like RCC1 family protein